MDRKDKDLGWVFLLAPWDSCVIRSLWLDRWGYHSLHDNPEIRMQLENIRGPSLMRTVVDLMGWADGFSSNIVPACEVLHFEDASAWIMLNNNDAPQWQRYGGYENGVRLHNGINGFLGKKLSFAESGSPPKRILEIVCYFSLTHLFNPHSGAWYTLHLPRAIQAAQMYPGAQVWAIDISPLPPWEVSAVCTHIICPVSRFLSILCMLAFCWSMVEVLCWFIDLLRPSGWLLIDNIEHNLSGEFGHGIKKFYEVYHSYMKPDKVDAMAGPFIEPILKASGKFSDVCMESHLNLQSFFGEYTSIVASL
ncbi:hypothetical protein JB92DRAFT_2833861 [Gautieria morchelliformis]|nr:hypothetical protein JB92DRAFT_2833861 [Gautieria morchelliformis]